MLDSVVSGAGGDPARVKRITIGFNAVPALLAGRVAAATAFWNDEGVALRRARPGFHIFRVDSYGAPAYPELVLCATRSLLRSDPGLATSVVAALVRGYRFTMRHPQASAAELESQVPGLSRALVQADLSALAARIRRSGRRARRARPIGPQRWARWEARFGIVKRPPNVGQDFDLSVVGSGAG